jgi:hypothetical protein
MVRLRFILTKLPWLYNYLSNEAIKSLAMEADEAE